ncbi:MAG: dTMP kinase [Candidatus Micrarchaeota archaeon]
MRGKLICFEGIDGSGKGTQVRAMQGREPSSILFTYPDKSWPIGRVISSFLKKTVSLSPAHQFLLYLADIYKDQERIRAMLESGKTVVLDRYIFSTLAYQDASGFEIKRGVGIAKELGFLPPDITFLIDIDPKTSVLRKRKQNNSLERFEKQRFLARVRKNYLSLAKEKFLSKKWLVVDGRKGKADMAEEIRLLVLKSR